MVEKMNRRTDTLDILTDCIERSIQHPRSIEEIIPALEKIARECESEKEHNDYQVKAIDLIGEIAKLDDAYVSRAREALENIRDDMNVSFYRRVHARKVLAWENKDFWRFWGNYGCHMIDLSSHTTPTFGDVGMAIVSNKIGADQFIDVCFVASVTSYHEIKQKDNEWTLLMNGLYIIQEELETGTIYNHSWDDAARISNSDPERLKQRYQTTIEQIRSLTKSL